MDRGPLHKYTDRIGPGGARDQGPDDSGGIESFDAFGWLRGFEAKAVMLELRQRNGNRLGVAYAWIARILYDPSSGIVISAGDTKVTIVGRNLDVDVRPGVALYGGLLR